MISDSAEKFRIELVVLNAIPLELRLRLSKSCW